MFGFVTILGMMRIIDKIVLMDIGFLQIIVPIAEEAQLLQLLQPQVAEALEVQ